MQTCFRIVYGLIIQVEFLLNIRGIKFSKIINKCVDGKILAYITNATVNQMMDTLNNKNLKKNLFLTYITTKITVIISYRESNFEATPTYPLLHL